MKKNTIILLSAIVFLVATALMSISSYNGLVTLDEGVKSQWGNVETQYQRRADLIPNLVATVKGYATHEQSTLEGVIAARAKATQITVDPTKITAEKLQEFQAAQGQISAALGRLIMLKETYPELKADKNFIELQAQIEGTENRISVERTRFNETAQAYNTAIRKFPRSIIASIGNFEAKPYFEAEKTAEKAPVVKF
jgi:LemA protein